MHGKQDNGFYNAILKKQPKSKTIIIGDRCRGDSRIDYDVTDSHNTSSKQARVNVN